jgi:trimeric autotransporter adhesin
VRTAFVTVLALLFLAVPAAANATFTRATSGTALSLSTATLGAPRNVTVPGTSSGSVAVSWNAPSGAPSAISYYVTRTTGSTTSPACGTSASNVITATSCTDTVTANGSYTYAVTAVFYKWSAVSASSSTVVVTATVGQLSFTQSPQSTKSDQSLGTVIVQLRDNSGNNVSTSGVKITLSLSNNTEGGTLAGTLSQTTGSTGNATFTGLSVDLVGSYTLTASASGYTAGTSSAFTIGAGQASQIKVVSGSGQSTTRGTSFANPLVVLVTDAEGNPVSGANVFYLASSVNNASGTFSNNNSSINTTTNSSGQASVTIKANSTAGTYSVFASVGGSSVATFTLTNR